MFKCFRGTPINIQKVTRKKTRYYAYNDTAPTRRNNLVIIFSTANILPLGLKSTDLVILEVGHHLEYERNEFWHVFEAVLAEHGWSRFRQRHDGFQQQVFLVVANFAVRQRLKQQQPTFQQPTTFV